MLTTAQGEARRHDWSVAIFGVNESETIQRCLLSIDAASKGHSTHVTVLLNGTTDDSLEKIRALKLNDNVAVSVYFCPKADKANAINQFIYELRPPANVYFFVDAYTKVGEGALAAIAAEFARAPGVLIVTGVPINGRSSQATTDATLKGGVVNGQLYALRVSFMDRLIAKGLRLPLGLYRGDSLLGSMGSHDLDPIATKWDNARIAGLGAAPFEIAPLSLFKWSDIRRQFNREIRQALGRFENEAIKSIIYARGYAALPGDAVSLVRTFLANHQVAPRSLKERYFTRLALQRIARAQTPQPADFTQTLVYVSPEQP
jgi:hypothetical protein